MVHPIFSVLISKPELVLDHMAGYAALVREEASSVSREVAARAIAWALVLLCLLVFLVLAGVAAMLAAMHGAFHWALVAAPCVPLLLAVSAFTMARRPLPSKVFTEVRAQLDADAQTLRTLGARMSEGADKLARSRLAILEHVTRKERRRDSASDSAGADSYEELAALGLPPGKGGDDAGLGAGWLGSIQHAVSAWWRHHPAHLMVELATPALSRYAGRKPLQFLGIAAAAGAVVMLARPWKLISATGLVMALLKSSQLSGLVMSAMAAAHLDKDQQRPPG